MCCKTARCCWRDHDRDFWPLAFRARQGAVLTPTCRRTQFMRGWRIGRRLGHLRRAPASAGRNDHIAPGALGLPNHARNGKISAERCDASRPTPNARAAGRQEPPCSASNPPPTQLPAQPKPRSVPHETLQSCFQAPSLPRPISEMHAFLTPINSLFPQLLPAS